MPIIYTPNETYLIQLHQKTLQDLWDRGMNLSIAPENRLAEMLQRVHSALTLANVMADGPEFEKFINYLKETQRESDQRPGPTDPD